MSELQTISLKELLTKWRPGSYEWSWEDEMFDLIEKSRTKEVFQQVEQLGIGFANHEDPIQLGNDGRVWDGHHRIIVAIVRGIEHLDVLIIP